jgi:hypothetical protein
LIGGAVIDPLETNLSETYLGFTTKFKNALFSVGLFKKEE